MAASIFQGTTIKILKNTLQFFDGTLLTNTVAGYLANITSDVQTQLAGKQSLSTVTTKGDLYVATASATTARMPAGTNGLFLKADSTQTNGLVYASPNGILAYRSVTTTDAATSADDVLVLSGASFTETLFTAVGNTGKVITLLHNGTSLSQIYTLATTSSQTIGGVASGSYVLYTNSESLKIISDGANWQILEHNTTTPWVSYTPTLNQTNQTTAGFWQRSGDTIFITTSTTFTGTPAGSSTFTYTIPGGMTFDTAKYSGVGFPTFGNAIAYDSSADFRYSAVSVTDAGSNTVRMMYNATASPLAPPAPFVWTTSDTLTLSFKIPISGWRP